jgi:hypothetical protein
MGNKHMTVYIDILLSMHSITAQVIQIPDKSYISFFIYLHLQTHLLPLVLLPMLSVLEEEEVFNASVL